MFYLIRNSLSLKNSTKVSYASFFLIKIHIYLAVILTNTNILNSLARFIEARGIRKID